jgi:hypothetical protein
MFHTLYHAAKIDNKLIIKGKTMTSEQIGLILKQFSNPEEIRHKEKETFEKERVDL